MLEEFRRRKSAKDFMDAKRKLDEKKQFGEDLNLETTFDGRYE